MPPKLLLTKEVLQRLNGTSADDHWGELFGIIYNGTVLIIGLNFNANFKEVGITNELRPYYRLIYPSGVDWCGLFYTVSSKDSKISKEQLSGLKDIAVTNNPVIIKRNIEDGSMEASLYYYPDEYLPVHYNIIDEDEFKKIFLIMRLKSTISLQLKPSIQGSIIKELHRFRKILSSGAAMFMFSSSNLCINNSCLYDVASNISLDTLGRNDNQLEDIVNCSTSGPHEVKVTFKISSEESVLSAECSDEYLLDLWEEQSFYDDIDAPSVQSLLQARRETIDFELPIDVMCIAQRERLVVDSYDLLMESLYRWLDLIRFFYTKRFIQRERHIVRPIRMCHFYPIQLGHFVTLVYPYLMEDEKLVNERSLLHQMFHLPKSTPFFRYANVLKFGARKKPLNVHVGLRSSTAINGTVALVKGNYEYYHYMQDNFDDRGWGCAYRSLQTIFSWYRLKGFTIKQVPSHNAIQKCLVKIGDKPTSFIGTKNWIGSTEISFCLDEMLGISSVILNVSSGQNMGSLGSQLLNHFQCVGTPVMIGGGNLAHTILGVDFNEETGAVMFLILDPHFVANSEKEYWPQIQKHGVFWKGLQFWSAQHFYNLCLPQLKSCF